jgi:hypothetical protein
VQNTLFPAVYETVAVLLSIPLCLFLEFFKTTLLSGFDSTTFSGSLGVSIVTAPGLDRWFIFQTKKVGFCFSQKLCTSGTTSPMTTFQNYP